MHFESLNLTKFLKLKEEIASYKRMSGYYLIDLVSIEVYVKNGIAREDILDAVFQHFDDVDWPPKSQRPSDQSWDHDYREDQRTAREDFLTVLIGGGDIGHLNATIPPEIAEDFFLRFKNFFSEDAGFYVRMGLGNTDYVFQHGLAIVDDCRAGIIWVVEND